MPDTTASPFGTDVPAPALAAASDDDLLLAVRCGDHDAFGELYVRYVADARRLARRLSPASDVEDVVAEAFTKVFNAIQRGHGPTTTPVRYLMVAVRTTAISSRSARTAGPELEEEPGRHLAIEDAVPGFEDELLLVAFRSLSPRWRQVIWWAEIEQLNPAEIGELTGLSSSAASALAYRARRALRDAYRAEQAQAPG